MGDADVDPLTKFMMEDEAREAEVKRQRKQARKTKKKPRTRRRAADALEAVLDDPLSSSAGKPASPAHSPKAKMKKKTAAVELETVVSLPGELLVMNLRDIFFETADGHALFGTLVMTNFKLVFFCHPKQAMVATAHLPPEFFVISIHSVERVEKITNGRKDQRFWLHLWCKDLRELRFGFGRNGSMADNVRRAVETYAFPMPSVEHLFAFAAPTVSDAGWDVFDADVEWRRLGLLEADSKLRVADINRAYDYCPSYPRRFVVPAAISDRQLARLAPFRSKARVPLLSWRHPVHGTTLWRCSQPKVGMGNERSTADESFLSTIRDMHARKELLIADARPKTNAMANKAAGWGYEPMAHYPGCSLVFMNIGNIHVMRNSLKALRGLVSGTSSSSDAHWLSAIDGTNWLAHMRTLLTGAIRIADTLHKDEVPVLVHCSDGWDRTSQLCGLAELLLDPFYRTMRGFCVLVCKDWLDIGHRFQERHGHGDPRYSFDHRSPIFLQFLDCVWQLTRQFPRAFEFNSAFLVSLADTVFSCEFGTFLGNCERERDALRLRERTRSVWGFLLDPRNEERFTSPFYSPQGVHVGPLLPHPCSVARNVTLWAEYYLRYSPLPSLPLTPLPLSALPHSITERSTAFAEVEWAMRAATTQARAMSAAFIAASATAGDDGDGDGDGDGEPAVTVDGEASAGGDGHAGKEGEDADGAAPKLERVSSATLETVTLMQRLAEAEAEKEHMRRSLHRLQSRKEDVEELLQQLEQLQLENRNLRELETSYSEALLASKRQLRELRGRLGPGADAVSMDEAIGDVESGSASGAVAAMERVEDEEVAEAAGDKKVRKRVVLKKQKGKRVVVKRKKSKKEVAVKKEETVEVEEVEVDMEAAPAEKEAAAEAEEQDAASDGEEEAAAPAEPEEEDAAPAEGEEEVDAPAEPEEEAAPAEAEEEAAAPAEAEEEAAPAEAEEEDAAPADGEEEAAAPADGEEEAAAPAEEEAAPAEAEEEAAAAHADAAGEDAPAAEDDAAAADVSPDDADDVAAADDDAAAADASE